MKKIKEFLINLLIKIIIGLVVVVLVAVILLAIANKLGFRFIINL